MRNKVAPILATLVAIIFAAPFLAKPAKTAVSPPTRPLPLLGQSKAHTPPSVINAKHPMGAQSAEGGLWRTDSTFQPVFMLKNLLEIAPMSVTPVLCMADGTEYDLAPVQLDPAGVAMVDIKTALADAPVQIQSHISSYGSAAIKFQWAWHAVFAAIRNSDEVRGLLYQTHLETDAIRTHDSSAPQTQQLVESTWWKQDPDVIGFLTLTNTSLSPVTVSVAVSDSGAANSAVQQYTVGPHMTKWIDFAPYWNQMPNNPAAGAIEVSYAGVMDAIALSGGMEDTAKGYSHMLHFQMPQSTMASQATSNMPPTPAPGTQQPQTTAPQPTTFDSTGLMVGAQDAAMQFPQGTVFTPYLVFRNTTTNPMPVQLAANTMLGGIPTDVPLGSVTLAPHESRQIDMKSMLNASKLAGFNGYINLRTTFAGNPTDLLQESGSVDQTLNYVFEVPPHLEETNGSARIFNYWNTNGDTDTMFTLFNYSNTEQDVLLTFEHQEGKYEMPIQLAAHASMTFSVSKLIRGGVPDRNGKIIPSSIVQGSAKITGIHGTNKERFNVAVFAGIFNARTGTCSYPCVPCNAGEEALIDPTDTNLPLGNSVGMAVWVVFTDGSSEDYTSDASFSSSNTSIVSTSQNNATGAAVGSATVTGNVFSVPGAGNPNQRFNCCGIAGCGEQQLSADMNADVTPTIFMNGQDITGTGTIQNVVIGQQIALTTSTGTLPDGVTVISQSWSIPGTNIGGWTPGSQPSSVTTNQSTATFYWISAGQSLSVTFTLNLSDGSSPSAQATFNVAAPTSPNLSVAFGTTNPAGLILQLGGSSSNIGANFTASATPPSGHSNTFQWVQIVNSFTTAQAESGATRTCALNNTPGLDKGLYPYDTVNPTDDNPNMTVDLNATTAQANFNATMYLMWSPGGTGSIFIPLGSVTWKWFGDATANEGDIVVKSDSNASVTVEFQQNSTFPTWTQSTDGSKKCNF